MSSESIKELEHIKTSKNKTEDLRYAARKAVRFLDKNPNKYHVVLYEDILEDLSLPITTEDTPDNRIILCAFYLKEYQKYDILFISDDILARLIAKQHYGLEVSSFNNIEDEIYKGYKIIQGNTQYINEYMSCFDKIEWNINEYLIIKNTDDQSTKEMRFNGTTFVPLRLPPSKYIKAKNELQRCALDILLNPDITVAAILGGYGSGKSFLTMQMALYHVLEKGNQSKILAVREIRGEGEDIGFLPGDKQEKIGDFFLPLSQQLHGGELELDSLKQQGILDSNIPYFMKGTTYHNTIFIVDEAEDLTHKQIRLIGTRLGVNSKIFLSGDFRQSVINASVNNALVEMCHEFRGRPNFACIYLDEDVRSDTSKMFADLFVK